MKPLKKIRNGVLAMSAASVGVMPTAYAGATSTDNKILASILDVVVKLAFYIGIVLLAWSVVMLVMAFKNEDADSKSRAIMLIAVSVVLIVVRPLLSTILNAAGFDY